MYGDSVLERHSDGKRFRVAFLAHWSGIESDDGEQDVVKWLGSDDYVAMSSGHLYTLVEAHASERPSHPTSYQTLIPPSSDVGTEEPFGCLCTTDELCDYHAALQAVMKTG